MGDEGIFSRNEGLFSAAGQRVIADTTVGIVGLGGLGAPLAQQLAYLGVERYALVDDDVVGPSSLNRLIGATEDDVGELKVEIAERGIRTVRTGADVRKAVTKVETEDATTVLDGVDVVFSCVDQDPVRMEIVKKCVSLAVPFFDLGTEIDAPEERSPTYGGRLLFSGARERCPSCMDLLDERRMRIPHLNSAEREAFEREYGVSIAALESTGPSVVSLNCVIASLAVTEFMVWRTGLRPPAPLLTYSAHLGGGVRPSLDSPAVTCRYCGRE
jgi:molybdopterin-synthase adenylyltransferase